MKILLVGEYSRLHNSLKEGLISLGHEVTLVSLGDGFKSYQSDFKIKQYFNKGLLSKIKVALFLATSFNIESFFTYLQCKNICKKLDHFDIVQYINETPFNASLSFEKKIINLFNSTSKKNFLLACGTDYISVKYAFDKKLRYSILTPYFENKSHKKIFQHILNKISTQNKKHYNYIIKNTNAVISSDLDYHIPYLGTEKYFGMISNPINTDIIDYIKPIICDKIVIFHGINTENSIKKGNPIFEKALDIIKKKYINKVEIIQTYNIPYNQYINHYNKAHILLDQIYAFDQGYNALEAMAKGKVVFTGAETEWLKYYDINEDTIAINALPNVDYLVEKLSFLIENPVKIEEISQNARNFIEEHHHYKIQAQKYISTWNKY